MKQVTADIVIVSAGTAGLAAAVAAAQAGASVIAFEKASTTGGTGNMANGPFAVESKLQKQKMITLTREEAFKLHMDYTHWRVDARLVRAFIDKSADTINWLESLGVEMGEVSSHTLGCNPTWLVIKGTMVAGQPHGLGAIMMKALTEKAQELGVKFYLQTPVKKLVKEDGHITGVIAEDPSGEDVRADAGAVIIATGGFGDSPEWIKKNTGFDWGRNLYSMRISGLEGDGIRMAKEVGAGTETMSMELTCGLSLALSPNRHSVASRAFSQPYTVLVNLLGERFFNEEIMGQNPAFTANAVARQKNGYAFSIFDEDTVAYYEKNGYAWDPTPVGDFQAEIKSVFVDGPDKLLDRDIFIANSLEELAGKTGINLSTLGETLEDYNRFCERGCDEVFAKSGRYLRPVKTPRFYAGKIIPGGFGSIGGIKINYKTEVITDDFDVIPGLYAAGTDANGIYADSYIYPLPGNTMGFALNSGRIAAENAVKYIGMH